MAEPVVTRQLKLSPGPPDYFPDWVRSFGGSVPCRKGNPSDESKPHESKLNSRAMNNLTFPAPGVAIQITKGDPFTRPVRRNAGRTCLAANCDFAFFASRNPTRPVLGRMLDVTGAVGQLHRKQFVKSRSDLDALGFQQHASDIVVLGRVADEEIHFSHEVLEQFGGFDQFPRFKRAEQASLAVFFLAGIFSFY